MPQNIVNPNGVVEGLARIFYFGLRREEIGRLLTRIGAGHQPLCGPKSYWWWQNGNACVEVLAAGEIPDGGLNTFSRPAFATLAPDNSEIYDRAYQLSKRLKQTARRLELDYWDLISTANPSEVRRAVRLAATVPNQ